LADLINNKTGPGVRRLDFVEKFQSGVYDVIAIRKGNNVPDLAKAGLITFAADSAGATYNSNPAVMINAACSNANSIVKTIIPLCNNDGNSVSEDMGSFFCSEFVALGLQNVTVLDNSVKAVDYIPANFVSSTQKLPLKSTISYNSEVYLFIATAKATPEARFLVNLWFFVFAVAILSVITGVGYTLFAIFKGLVSVPKDPQEKEMKDAEVKAPTNLAEARRLAAKAKDQESGLLDSTKKSNSVYSTPTSQGTNSVTLTKPKSGQF